MNDETLIERQPGESARSYAAFLDYCRMGVARSLRLLGNDYREQSESSGQAERPPTARLATLFDWSVAHRWQERIKAWDAVEAAKKQAAYEAAIVEMCERHAKVALLGQARIVEKLNGTEPLTMEQALRYLPAVVQLEREARGWQKPNESNVNMNMGGTVVLEIVEEIVDAPVVDDDPAWSNPLTVTEPAQLPALTTGARP